MSKEMRQYIDNFENFLTENSKKKLNKSDVKYSEVNILQLKKSVEETIQLFHTAIWALEDGSKEQEMFMSANNKLNDFFHKYLSKY